MTNVRAARAHVRGREETGCYTTHFHLLVINLLIKLGSRTEVDAPELFALLSIEYISYCHVNIYEAIF